MSPSLRGVALCRTWGTKQVKPKSAFWTVGNLLNLLVAEQGSNPAWSMTSENVSGNEEAPERKGAVRPLQPQMESQNNHCTAGQRRSSGKWGKCQNPPSNNFMLNFTITKDRGKRLGIEGRGRKREKDGPSKRNPVLEELKGDNNQDFKLRVELPKQFNQKGLYGNSLLQTYCMLLQETDAISQLQVVSR